MLSKLTNTPLRTGHICPNLTWKVECAELLEPKLGSAMLLCTVDLRTVNKYLIKYQYPIPRIADALWRLQASYCCRDVRTMIGNYYTRNQKSNCRWWHRKVYSRRIEYLRVHIQAQLSKSTVPALLKYILYRSFSSIENVSRIIGCYGRSFFDLCNNQPQTTTSEKHSVHKIDPLVLLCHTEGPYLFRT